MNINKNDLKIRFNQEIKKTEEAIIMYKDMAKPQAPDEAIGRVSRMDAINNKSVTDMALRNAEKKLKSLKRMLQNINDDDFGLCGSCSKPIPVERLFIKPESPFCVSCLEKR